MTAWLSFFSKHRNNDKALKNAEALKDIFLDNYDALCSFSEKILGDNKYAEDAVIESFVKLWSLESGYLENIKKARAFLYSTVRNLCIDHLRRKERLETGERIYLLHFTDELYIENEPEAMEYILAEIEKLPPKCREVFKLMFIESLSIDQIAKKLALSSQTIRNHKSFGVKLIRQNLEARKIFFK